MENPKKQVGDNDVLPRIQIKKHKEFANSYFSYTTKEENRDLWIFFNTPTYRISEKVVSYRVISHWEKLGIIRKNREKNAEWRKFSLMDVIWIFIVKHLRHFGLSLTAIKSVRFDLVSGSNECPYGELEFYVALAYLKNAPIHVLVFHDFSAEVGTYYEISESIEKYGMFNHISIELNGLLQMIFPKKDLKPAFEGYFDFSQEEYEVIETIRDKGISEIQLKIKKGMPEYMECLIVEDEKAKLGQLKSKDANQNITTKQHDWKTVRIERVVKKNFKKK